jgi:hypothetical protein
MIFFMTISVVEVGCRWEILIHKKVLALTAPCMCQAKARDL